MSFDTPLTALLPPITVLLIVLLIVLPIALLIQGGRREARLAARCDALKAEMEDDTGRRFARLEDQLYLRDRLGLRQGLPGDRDWSAAPDFLKLIVEHALAAQPAVIVECGSGLTTLMLARCCELNGRGKVYSLEHGARYAANTRGEIERYGLGQYATVIDAPIEKQSVDGVEYPWYGLDDLHGMATELATEMAIDMLVIDGPPGFLQRHARYPALPLLLDRLAVDCTAFLDDAARQEEREIVEMWRKRFPAIQHEYVETERGCSILRMTGGQPRQYARSAHQSRRRMPISLV